MLSIRYKCIGARLAKAVASCSRGYASVRSVNLSG
jgi:hypothetical protein